jgi:hypothetical protein
MNDSIVEGNELGSGARVNWYSNESCRLSNSTLLD